MKPLSLEETGLKEEMKERCLNKGQYVDENAKAKFDMLCHLEDFEVAYWQLERENQELKKQLEESDFKIANLTMDKIELKKQLEEYKKWYKDALEEKSELSKLWCANRANIRELKNQRTRM